MRATKTIIRGERGQALVMVAVSLSVLLGMAGFATDIGVVLHERRMAQTAADAAAIGAAEEALLEEDPTTLSTGEYTAAAKDATLNGFTPGSSSGTASTTTGTTLTVNIGSNITISAYQSAGYIQAIVTQNTPSIFMKVLGLNSMNVSASAIASDSIKSNGCIYVQNDGGYDNNDTMDLNGNTLVTASQCGVTVNGTLNMNGNAKINAGFVAAEGNITGKNASPDWTSGVPPQGDPKPSLQYLANQPTIDTKAGTCTLPQAAANAGMSCVYDYNGGNLSGKLSANTVYVFDESGGPSIGNVTGSGDMIYLVGNIPFDFNNNGTVSISAWTKSDGTCIGSSNPYCGILIDAPTDGSGGAGTYTCSSGNGNNKGNPGELYFDFGSSNTTLAGVVYAPYAQLFTKDNGSSVTIDTALVVGNICSQSAQLTVDGYSGPQSPLTRIGLVF